MNFLLHARVNKMHGCCRIEEYSLSKTLLTLTILQRKINQSWGVDVDSGGA
jgi:hypothetical protein